MEVVIEKLDHFGRGIAHVDGKICFIKNALPGEVVDIEIVKNKKKWSEAKVCHYKRKSLERKKPFCPYYEECGGCSLQHISFKDENSFKEKKVKELIQKFLGENTITFLPLSYGDEYFYRNKISLHGNMRELGYYEEKSNNFLAIEQCCLANDKINQLLSILNDKKYLLSHLMIRTSNDSSQVILKMDGDISNVSELREICDVLIVNGKIISEQKEIVSKIGKMKYYLSADSFFQVNASLTERLYDEIRKVVKKYKPKKVLDLYCGTGTIGLYIHDIVEQIIGIDVSFDAIEDANKNKELNDASNIFFLCDKVENKIDSFFEEIDFIIVDPPRNGLDPKTISHLLRITPDHIVYVSCDPVTLARDLKPLLKNYKIEYIKPFNMFPRTYHVECVCVLSRC